MIYRTVIFIVAFAFSTSLGGAASAQLRCFFSNSPECRYMAACAKDLPSSEEYCQCKWKIITHRFPEREREFVAELLEGQIQNPDSKRNVAESIFRRVSLLGIVAFPVNIEATEIAAKELCRRPRMEDRLDKKQRAAMMYLLDAWIGEGSYQTIRSERGYQGARFNVSVEVGVDFIAPCAINVRRAEQWPGGVSHRSYDRIDFTKLKVFRFERAPAPEAMISVYYQGSDFFCKLNDDASTKECFGTKEYQLIYTEDTSVTEAKIKAAFDTVKGQCRN